jgi:hypothetical protein
MRKLLLGLSVVALAGVAGGAEAIDLVTGGSIHVRHDVEVLVGPIACHDARGQMISHTSWRAVCLAPVALVVGNRDCEQAGGRQAQELMPNGGPTETVCIYAHGQKPWPAIWNMK